MPSFPEVIEISDSELSTESNDDVVVLEGPRRSSPAPPPSSLPSSSQAEVYDISDLTDDDEEEVPDASQILRSFSKHLNRGYQSGFSGSPSEPLKRKTSSNEDLVDDDLPKPKTKRKRKASEEKILELAAKELQKAQKKNETQRKRAEVAARKAEEKAAHKASKATNKLVNDKKTTLKDMIIELSPCLINSPLYLPLKQKMAEYNCQVQPIFASGDTVELVDVNAIRNLDINIIRWKRHVKATYDESQRKWVPLPEDRYYYRPEGTYLIYVTGDELIDCLSSRPTAPSLETQVAMLRRVLGPKYHIHLMLCGWKGKTNRVTVLDYVQTKLVTLQVKESLFVEEVKNINDAVTWLYNISADLGIKPHKLIERSYLPFCPQTSGNFRTGKTNTDTFEKMLAQLPRLSERSARAIVKQYGSINKVMEEYKRIEATGGGPMMLANVAIPGSDRILNKALSERLYYLLRGSDPKILVN